jgi:hypothetical protein
MSQFDLNGGRAAGPFAGALAVLLGIGCIAAAIWLGMQTQELLTHGIHTQGKVVGMEQEMRTETRRRQGLPDMSVQKTFYHPVVEFDDGAHHGVRFTERTGNTSPAHNKGETVTVIYLEKDPKGTAIIDEGVLNWFVPGILAILGLIFTLGGAWTISRQRSI